MNNKTLANNIWILFIVIVFSIIYCYSNTYSYVEGDDATSIAYHLLGRHKTFQPPYSPYHGMMDKLLSSLPADDGVLRTTAFGITRYANILMMVLIILLGFSWFRSIDINCPPLQRILISAIVLLAVPEIFYLGLVYSPSLVAMCLVLSAHLILRWSYLTARPLKYIRLFLLIGAITLFGFGVAFRWNVIAYGLVIVIDLIMLQPTSEPIYKRLFFAAGWGVLALLSAFVMIILSGYGFADIFGEFGTILYVIHQAGTSSPGSEISLTEAIMRTGLTLSPLFSPIFVLLISVGLIKLALLRNKWLFIIVLAGILSILPWARSGVPKFIITVLPSLILVFMYGLINVFDYLKQKRFKFFSYTFLLIGLLFPWLVGIRVDREGSAWGPGFELKPFNYTDTSGTQIHFVFSSGMAFPTPEGVRPLYGHGYVLLGKWDKFIDDAAAERQVLIDTALRLDVPLVITKWSPDYYLDDLYAMGFTTSNSYTHTTKDGYFVERRFTNPQGKTIIMLYHEAESADMPELVSHLEQDTNSRQIALTGYPQTMRELYEDYFNNLQIIGSTSAVVDLKQLKTK